MFHFPAIRVICLYPTVSAGKQAREWIERALGANSTSTLPLMEFFNYSVLSHDAISWTHVFQRFMPDLILMLGDGSHALVAGLRNSLRELLKGSCNGSAPLVIFRDLEPAPTINTRTLVDYVSALTRKNHCEFNAIDSTGMPMSGFSGTKLLLKPRKRYE